MRVLQVSAELFPLLKTGGLADVAAALPPVLAGLGLDARLLLPGFAALRNGVQGLHAVAELATPWGLRAQLLRGQWQGLGAYVVDLPELYGDGSQPYTDAGGAAQGVQVLRRFALLGQAAAALCAGADAAWAPHILHAHDWHAGLGPALLRAQRQGGVATGVRSVFTIHNLAYQGLFASALFADLGLPPQAFQMQGVEFHGQVSFMKAGLHAADQITTVSPGYAREVLTPEQGCGLDGLLRERAACLTGILNGVDPGVWHPAHDAHIAQAYDARRLGAKATNKAVLQAALGLAPRPEALLFGVVSRLTEQKGLHLVLQGLPRLLELGGQLVVQGSGDTALQAALAAAARAHPQAVALATGYDEPRAHRIFAGADVILVPSRFEPCGLTQLYGLAYGSLPLVHAVGGLADTVVDAALENLDDASATGFVFHDFTSAAYDAALRRAFALYAQGPAWRRVQRAAMGQQHDWAGAAQHYQRVYDTALARPSNA